MSGLIVIKDESTSPQTYKYKTGTAEDSTGFKYVLKVVKISEKPDIFDFSYVKLNDDGSEVSNSTISITNLNANPVSNKDLIFIPELNVNKIVNIDALTENIISGIILKSITEIRTPEPDPEDSSKTIDRVTYNIKYYEINASGNLTEKSNVVESNGYVGTKSVYNFVQNYSHIVPIQTHDKYRPSGYTFTIKKEKSYHYTELVANNNVLPKVHLYYPLGTSVINPLLTFVTCDIITTKTVETIQDKVINIHEKIYSWNDNYKYHLKTEMYTESDVQYYDLKYKLVHDGTNELNNNYSILTTKTTTDPFLSLIMVGNDNGILNVDISYLDFSRIILKKILAHSTNPDGFIAPEESWEYYLVDELGQIGQKLTESEVNALQIQNNVTNDGRQIIEYYESTTSNAVIIINLSKIITAAIDSDGDQLCTDISNYIESINEFKFEKVGQLSDYQGLISKINQYTDAIQGQKVDLALDQIAALEGYAGYINQMSSIFGQLMASIETTSLVDATALQVRIKAALKLILDGLRKVQKFKIAITDSRIIGIPECILEMSSTLEKILGESGALDKYERMINFFLSSGMPTSQDIIDFGLSEDDKNAIKAAENLLTKYINDVNADIRSIKNHESIVNLNVTMEKFNARKDKLIELNNKLLYTLGASGIKITLSSNQTTSTPSSGSGNQRKTR